MYIQPLIDQVKKERIEREMWDHKWTSSVRLCATLKGLLIPPQITFSCGNFVAFKQIVFRFNLWGKCEEDCHNLIYITCNKEWMLLLTPPIHMLCCICLEILRGSFRFWNCFSWYKCTDWVKQKYSLTDYNYPL